MIISEIRKIQLLSLAAFVALTGCEVVDEARRQQKDAEPAMSERFLSESDAKNRRSVTLPSTSLKFLVDYAMTNRPAMVSAALAVKDARLRLKSIAADAPLASKTPWNAVNADLSLGYSESSSAEHFDDFDTSTSRGDLSGSVSLNILLWDFGRNDARRRAAAENVIAAELELVQTGYKVFNEVSDAYFTLLQNEALLEVAVSNINQYAAHLSQAQARFEHGYGQNLDVLRAKLDLARAHEAVVAASNDVAVAGVNLVAYLGISDEVGDYRTVFGGPIGGLDRVMRGFNDTTNTINEVFAHAKVRSPALKVARARLRAASADVDYSIADLKPNISANLSLNWTDPLWLWRWGLSGAQSLFTGWGKSTAVERATVALKIAQNDLESAQLQLSRNLEVAIAERDNARKAENTARESLVQARENLETVKSQYEVEEVSRIEFTDAVSYYTEAVGNRVKSFYRGQMAEAAIFELIGAAPIYNEVNITEKRK